MGWQEFYETFGGKVFLCHQAVDKLHEQFELGQERLFDPFNVRDNAGLDDLIGDPLTRKHMENLAQKGWSPIEGGAAEAETESQKGARIIAKKNFGAIIARQTTTFFDEELEGRYVQRPSCCAGSNSTNYIRTQVHPADGGHGETKQLGLQRKTFPLEQPLVSMSPSHFAVCLFLIFQEHLSETRTIFSPSLLG